MPCSPGKPYYHGKILKPTLVPIDVWAGASFDSGLKSFLDDPGKKSTIYLCPYHYMILSGANLRSELSPELLIVVCSRITVKTTM